MEQPARRKLLRGTLAAPLVLTVTSPSVLAASSFQACIARVADQPQPGASLMITDLQDSWLRTPVSIYSGMLRGGAGVTARYYKSPTDQLFYREDGTSACTGFDATAFTGTGGPTPLNITRYALVYIDTAGVPVGLGTCKPATGYAVSASCWSSFSAPA
jgi:hypothetical protein